MGDHYQTLGLQRDASKADIKNAYFRLAHRYHPDHHNHVDAAARAEAARRFRQAKDAYDVLSDYHRRAEYDHNLRRSSSSSSSSGYRTSSSTKQGNRQGGASSSSSSSSTSSQHGHGGSRSRPRPPDFQRVLVGAYVVLMVLDDILEAARDWENMKRDAEKMKRQIEKMKIGFQMRKRRWENMKQEWEKKNPWKSWMESREKEKTKNWWTGIFRS